MGKKSRRVRTGKKMTDADKKAIIEKDNNTLKLLSNLPASHINSYIKNVIRIKQPSSRIAAMTLKINL